jgi:circadian clock protein KaiC
MHLATIHKLIGDFRPEAVVMDPVTNMMSIGEANEVKAMLTRLVDFLKNQGITAIFTSLTGGGEALAQSEVGISSLMDTWLLLQMVESNNERNRVLYVLKSRGMAHSNQMREFVLSDRGIKLVDVYVGPGTVLTGSARLAQESREKAEAAAAREAAERRRRELRQERSAIEAQIKALQARLAGTTSELKIDTSADLQRAAALTSNRQAMAKMRAAD